MSAKPKCDSWKPIRRGLVYCSPACGFDCTYEAFLKAQEEAEALARRCGPRWKPRVWENCGWHYAATSPGNNVKVHPGKIANRTHYTVFFGCPGSVGGDFTSQGYRLKETINAGLEKAKTRAKNSTALVGEIEVALCK